MENKISELKKGLYRAFIDNTYICDDSYLPSFLRNNRDNNQKVLTSIEDELTNCDEFIFSVAFITKSGLTPLLEILKELEHKGVKGKILTTDYLCFSEPEALDKLAQLSNIELKMYISDKNDGFHTKGYIFKKDNIYRMIVGSSNITLSALTTNKEWNTKVVSSELGEYANDLLAEFTMLWDDNKSLAYDDFIESYKKFYTKNKILKNQHTKALMDKTNVEAKKLVPNKMQVAFITNLKEIYAKGEKKALLISATGTGKTYASAFAARELEFKKVLFLVHRKEIINQAMKAYKNVLLNDVSYGIFSGSQLDYDSDYIFAMVQTLSKDNNLLGFDKDYFEFIIVDEAHHSVANTYQKIFDYFTPKLWLGMSATPDRREGDGSKNVYELFNHQIAYEIRLQDALEEDLLCPFHYFGISDLEMIDDNKKTSFNNLTCDERVKHIMQQADYYGYSGNRVKGLIFVSRNEEANALSAKFNERGWRTLALSGSNTSEERLDAIERLVSDNREDYLDYIISVDIFSEGVDVPEINQVIMLRPTQSPIVFIQQLGRGLRKAIDKEYVVILDFIANYENNFMIPIALSGDRSYNKDNIRRYVSEGSRVIPGASSIHFDEVSRKRIFSAIDNAKFSAIKLIKENYQNLKNKLGRIPSLMDFDKYGEMDVFRIFENKELGSYYKFLVKHEKEYTIRLSEDEEIFINFISNKIANGKRVHELVLLKRLLAYEHNLMGGLKKTLASDYQINLNDNGTNSVVNVMTNEFMSGSGKDKYAKCIFLKKEGNDFTISDEFKIMLGNNNFYAMVNELIDFGISRYQKNYHKHYLDTNLTLYQKYTYEDVCRLLEWDQNVVAQNIGGYFYDENTKTFPVFINYDKHEAINDSIKYEDRFISNKRLIAISKNKRNLTSKDVQNFINCDERGIKVELFVRKNKDDKVSKEFYYLGRMHFSGNAKEIVMAKTFEKAVEIEWILQTAVREDIYDYITKG